MRIAENPRSTAPHDQLEFRDIVRGWQSEERQKWISEMLVDKEHQRDCRDEDLLERLWTARNVLPMLLPTRWWSRTQAPEEMLGFDNEAQGWLPCKIRETDPHGELWKVDWWDKSQEERAKGEAELQGRRKRQVGGTGSSRELGQKDVPTAETRTGRQGNGGQRRSGHRITGIRNGEIRNVGSVCNNVRDTMGSRRDHTGEERAPKREDESPFPRWYCFVNQRTRD